MTVQTKAFLRDLGERVGWTAVQAFLATLLLELGKQATSTGLDITTIHWRAPLGIAAGAAVLSVIKGLIAYKANPATGASTGTTEPVAPIAAPDADVTITDGAGIPPVEPDEDVDTSDVDVEPASFTGK